MEPMTLIRTKPNSKAQAIEMPNMRESAPPRDDRKLFHCRISSHLVINLWFDLITYRAPPKGGQQVW